MRVLPGDAIDGFLTTRSLRKMSPGAIRGCRYDPGRMRRLLTMRGVEDTEAVTPAICAPYVRIPG